MSLRVLIHNVGHGQAVHIFTPANETIVIDLGCRSDFSPLEWLRKQRDTIDKLIITHPHGDHIDELLLIKQLEIEVRQLWHPRWLDEDAVYKQNQAEYTERLDAYFEMSNRYSHNVPEYRLVGNPEVSGGVTLKTYSSSTCGTSNINNHSGVVVIDYEGTTIVIPGDNEPPSWRELMKQPAFAAIMQRANIFMASHHGRESGYCSDIFTGKPNLCVVSDGRKQDTDATSRYSYHASGLKVQNRSSLESEDRYCVTTRSNGYIDINVGRDSNGSIFRSVKID